MQQSRAVRRKTDVSISAEITLVVPIETADVNNSLARMFERR